MSAFLSHTRTPSKNFMIILISDRPDGLDTAVKDRITEYIKFDLPTLGERSRLVRLYFTPGSQMKSPLKVDNIDYDALCSKISERSSGCSAREIAQLGQKWQIIYRSAEGVLNEDQVMKLVEKMLKERSKWKLDIQPEKEKMLNGNQLYLESNHKKGSN